MTPQEFIAKWKPVTLTERSACQQHFLDLCEVLDQPKPAKADPEGTFYTFERGVRKSVPDADSVRDAARGWADVWWRDHFGWEYKGKHRDLKAAYNQLLQYREDLENPPLLVVCDMDRFEIHTNFTGTVKRVYAFDLDGLADPDNLGVLRKMFIDPQSLKPGQTAEAVTAQAAEHFGRLADGMRQRGIPAEQAARFLMKLMFCMFAEDIALLQNKVFTRILTNARSDPAKLSQFLGQLFEAMSTGGYFGADEVLHFNGGLFRSVEFIPRESDRSVEFIPRESGDGAESHSRGMNSTLRDVVDLSPDEIKTLITVNRFDWSSVEPSIFGTLFERTLDPAKRSQIGAHYTSRDDILTLLEPVMMTPLRREWAAVRQQCDEVTRTLAASGSLKPATRRRRLKQRDQLLRNFVERLAHVTVLDPACGSGNFLYVALHLLLDLEKEVIAYAARQGIGLFPHVRPTQLAGLEINRYAQELAQVVIWIGYLQWMRDNGFAPPRDPVLEPIESIRLMDAILDLTNPAAPLEPEWPEAEFIVGNPPFLGNRLMAGYYEPEYLSKLYSMYLERFGGKPDLCCYWFEKARSAIERGRSQRAGLLATQGIRGGTNRNVLNRIKSSGEIFFAVSDREWLLDGAMVHVSMVGFDDGTEKSRLLDGKSVSSVNANLTAGVDTTKARTLTANRNIAFQGGIKRGSFDVSDAKAQEMLRAHGNPHGRRNSDVILPYLNAADVTQHNRHVWVVHFGRSMPIQAASKYECPFRYVESVVKDERSSANQPTARDNWWLHWNVRGQLEESIQGLDRWIVTPRVGKHRVFAWVFPPSYVDNALVAFATDDDYMFGVLHSRVHELWALSQGTQLRERESGFRYTPTTCFETFPFPEPSDAERSAISAAAKELDELRNRWLYPPDLTRNEILEFPGNVDGPWKRFISDHSDNGIGMVRYERTVPRDEECEKLLKKRTLTKLYNERPTWLDLVHRKLDEAVCAAYGWNADIANEQVIGNLLELNLALARDRHRTRTPEM